MFSTSRWTLVTLVNLLQPDFIPLFVDFGKNRTSWNFLVSEDMLSRDQFGTTKPMNNEPQRCIQLVPLVRLDTASLLKIRDIRNQEGVRKWMYTDHEIEVSEHLQWIDHLKEDSRQIVFAVIDQDSNPLGVVSVNEINRKHARADWAYYLTADARGGLGAALEYSFLNFVFDRLSISKLNCEVIEGNDAVVKLHKKFLFQEEGFRRSNVSRGAHRCGVFFLGLVKEEWLQGRRNVYDRYAKVLDKFFIKIEWNEDTAIIQ